MMGGVAGRRTTSGRLGRMPFFSSLFGRARRRAERDIERRVGVFGGEVSAFCRQVLSPADDAGVPPYPAIDDERARALAAEAGRLRSRSSELALSAEDVELELEQLDGLEDAIALRAALGRGEALPAVPTSHRAVAGETCHVAAVASRLDHPGDPGGRLFFTDRRITYLGAPPLRLGWGHVARVLVEGRDLVVVRRSGERLVFRCNSFGDVPKAAIVASEVLRPR